MRTVFIVALTVLLTQSCIEVRLIRACALDGEFTVSKLVYACKAIRKAE